MKLFQLFPSLVVRNSQTRVTLRQYGTLFVTYLGPQWFKVSCMALLLIGSIALELLGPQLIRTFIDTVQSNSSIQVLTIIALFYLGTALGNRLVAAMVTSPFNVSPESRLVILISTATGEVFNRPAIV